MVPPNKKERRANATPPIPPYQIQIPNPYRVDIPKPRNRYHLSKDRRLEKRFLIDLQESLKRTQRCLKQMMDFTDLLHPELSALRYQLNQMESIMSDQEEIIQNVFNEQALLIQILQALTF